VAPFHKYRGLLQATMALPGGFPPKAVEVPPTESRRAAEKGLDRPPDFAWRPPKLASGGA